MSSEMIVTSGMSHYGLSFVAKSIYYTMLAYGKNGNTAPSTIIHFFPKTKKTPSVFSTKKPWPEECSLRSLFKAITGLSVCEVPIDENTDFNFPHLETLKGCFIFFDDLPEYQNSWQLTTLKNMFPLAFFYLGEVSHDLKCTSESGTLREAILEKSISGYHQKAMVSLVPHDEFHRDRSCNPKKNLKFMWFAMSGKSRETPESIFIEEPSGGHLWPETRRDQVSCICWLFQKKTIWDDVLQ